MSPANTSPRGATPVELSPDAVRVIRYRVRWGWTIFLVLGSVFAPVTILFHPPLGLTSLGLALLCAGYFFVRRQALHRDPGLAMGLGGAMYGYWQAASILGGFAAFSTVAPPDLVLLLAAVYIPALIYAYWIYYPRYLAGWEKMRRHNETKVLDLERGTYEAVNGFQLYGPGMGPIESTFYRIVLPVTPFLFGGFALRRLGLDALDRLFGAAMTLWFGIIITQMVIQPWIHYDKLREYERRIGRRFVNR